MNLYINGVVSGYLLSDRYSASYLYGYMHSAQLPIWLPENTQLGFSGGYANYQMWFSVIEYTVH